MKLVYAVIWLWILSAMIRQAAAQDINFSQFYELPMLRNPGLAGIFKGDVRLTSAYRNQWQSVTVPYRTVALGGEVRFAVGGDVSNDYLTLGLQVTQDVAGDSKLGRLQVLPVLSFQKSVSENRDSYISAGFMAGTVQQRFDPSGLSFDDQFVNGAYSRLNPTQATFSRTSLSYFDDAAGLCFNSSFSEDSHYYIGVGLFHFTQPKVAFLEKNDVRLNKKFVVNLGLSTPTSEYDKFTVYGDYFNQGGNNLFQGGFLYTHDLLQLDENFTKAITFGAFFRWGDALVPVVRLEVYQLAIGVSYDTNISKLKPASQYRGGTEITLSYRDFLNIRNTSADKVRCPGL